LGLCDQILFGSIPAYARSFQGRGHRVRTSECRRVHATGNQQQGFREGLSGADDMDAKTDVHLQAAAAATISAIVTEAAEKQP